MLLRIGNPRVPLSSLASLWKSQLVNSNPNLSLQSNSYGHWCNDDRKGSGQLVNSNPNLSLQSNSYSHWCKDGRNDQGKKLFIYQKSLNVNDWRQSSSSIDADIPNAFAPSPYVLLYSCPNTITRRATALVDMGKRGVLISLMVLPTTWMTGLISGQTYVQGLLAVPLGISTVTFGIISLGLGLQLALSYLWLSPQILHRPITDLYMHRDSFELKAVSEPLLGPKVSVLFSKDDVKPVGKLTYTKEGRSCDERILSIKNYPLLFIPVTDVNEKLTEETEEVKHEAQKLFKHFQDDIAYPKHLRLR